MREGRSGRADPIVERAPRLLAVVKPAEGEALSALRHAAVDFAASHGADREVLDDVALAVSEAATNAVKHASVPAGAGIVELTGSVVDAWLELRVRDRGRGFGTEKSDGLGMGLIIIATLAAHLTICQEGHGTEVQMRFPLPR